MTERNRIAVAVPSQELAEFLIRYAAMHDGAGARPFPADTRYLRAYYDPELDQFVLFYEHPEFPRTAPGAVTPRVRLVVGPALLTDGES